MKTPQVKPNWTKGRFAVVMDVELVGYFVRFNSAWKWRNYLATTTNAARILIMDKGEIVNIWNRG